MYYLLQIQFLCIFLDNYDAGSAYVPSYTNRVLSSAIHKDLNEDPNISSGQPCSSTSLASATLRNFSQLNDKHMLYLSIDMMSQSFIIHTPLICTSICMFNCSCHKANFEETMLVKKAIFMKYRLEERCNEDYQPRYCRQKVRISAMRNVSCTTVH